MKVQINGNQHSFEQKPLTLEFVLNDQNLLNREGIAVAVNQNVIQKNNWSNYILENNDQIIIITATQGG